VDCRRRADRLTSRGKRAAGAPVPCLECGAVKVRNRGLCKPCYYQPATRARYPRLTTAGRKVPRRGNFAANLYGLAPRTPPEPTAAEPGSPAKIAVMAARFAARQELWHARDARLPRGSSALASGTVRRCMLTGRQGKAQRSGVDDYEGHGH
jgi:hypothetical protein